MTSPTHKPTATPMAAMGTTPSQEALFRRCDEALIPTWAWRAVVHARGFEINVCHLPARWFSRNLDDIPWFDGDRALVVIDNLSATVRAHHDESPTPTADGWVAGWKPAP